MVQKLYDELDDKSVNLKSITSKLKYVLYKKTSTQRPETFEEAVAYLNTIKKLDAASQATNGMERINTNDGNAADYSSPRYIDGVPVVVLDKTQVEIDPFKPFVIVRTSNPEEFINTLENSETQVVVVFDPTRRIPLYKKYSPGKRGGVIDESDGELISQRGGLYNLTIHSEARSKIRYAFDLHGKTLSLTFLVDNSSVLDALHSKNSIGFEMDNSPELLAMVLDQEIKKLTHIVDSKIAEIIVDERGAARAILVAAVSVNIIASLLTQNSGTAIVGSSALLYTVNDLLLGAFAKVRRKKLHQHFATYKESQLINQLQELLDEVQPQVETTFTPYSDANTLRVRDRLSHDVTDESLENELVVDAMKNRLLQTTD